MTCYLSYKTLSIIEQEILQDESLSEEFKDDICFAFRRRNQYNEITLNKR